MILDSPHKRVVVNRHWKKKYQAMRKKMENENGDDGIKSRFTPAFDTGILRGALETHGALAACTTM